MKVNRCLWWPLSQHTNPLIIVFNVLMRNVKLVTLAEGDPKAPFSISKTPRCKGLCNSISWIVPLNMPIGKLYNNKATGKEEKMIVCVCVCVCVCVSSKRSFTMFMSDSYCCFDLFKLTFYLVYWILGYDARLYFRIFDPTHQWTPPPWAPGWKCKIW